ncbi:MAG: hypothetical protein HY904_02305 [Deltaproteobacteria bacterium]|nr:hypothetical protein [Deltaproteobacteria bacterium]
MTQPPAPPATSVAPGRRRTTADPWRTHRRWTVGLWVSWLGWLPASLALGLLGGLIGVDTAPLILLWFGAMVGTGLGIQFVKCPRCGQSFYAKRYGGNPVARLCLHCGQARWRALPSPDSPWLPADEVTRRLRAVAGERTPVELVQLVFRWTEEEDPGALAVRLREAFPAMPRRVYRRLRSWQRFGGPLGDDEFNALFGPWFRGRR